MCLNLTNDKMFQITFFLDKIPSRITNKMRSQPNYVPVYPGHHDRVWSITLAATSMEDAMDAFVRYLEDRNSLSYFMYVLTKSRVSITPISLNSLSSLISDEPSQMSAFNHHDYRRLEQGHPLRDVIIRKLNRSWLHMDRIRLVQLLYPANEQEKMLGLVSYWREAYTFFREHPDQKNVFMLLCALCVPRIATRTRFGVLKNPSLIRTLAQYFE